MKREELKRGIVKKLFTCKMKKKTEERVMLHSRYSILKNKINDIVGVKGYIMKLYFP